VSGFLDRESERLRSVHCQDHSQSDTRKINHCHAVTHRVCQTGKQLIKGKHFLGQRVASSYRDLEEDEVIPRISKTIPTILSLSYAGIAFAVLENEFV